MQEIFNLSKIKKLVDSEHPPAIIVVDTNIVIDAPDFRQWKTPVNEPIFVIPDIVIIELERLKRKNKKEKETTKYEPTKYDEAIKSLCLLFDQGDITEGIHIAEAGWFISISSSDEEAMNNALSQMGSIVEALHKNDCKFIILTRELRQLMPDNTVVFYTKDYSLYLIAGTGGFPACRFEGFPMTGIGRWIEKKKPEPLDWDKELADQQRAAEDKLIDVEFTLMSKELVRDMETPMYIHMDIEEIPPTLEKLDYIVAKGCGCVHFPDDPVHFLWSVPYKPFTSETLASDSLRGEPDPVDWSLIEPGYFPFGPPGVFDFEITDIDFLRRDKADLPGLKWYLMEKLFDCVSPHAYIASGMPTLQSPICVAEWFIRRKITKQVLSYENVAPEAFKLIEISPEHGYFNDYESLSGVLIGMLSGRFSEDLVRQDLDPQDVGHFTTILDFVNAVTSCWNIGHTVRTRMLNP